MHVGLALTLSFGIGVIAGLRTFTAPAATAWAARLHWLNLTRSHLAFMGSAWTVAIFTLGVAVESVADQLPSTGARTTAPQLAGRIITGSLSGACLGISGGATVWLAAVMGAIGSVVGAFSGHRARVGLVRALHVPDFVIAIPEDVVAIVLGFWFVSRF